MSVLSSYEQRKIKGIADRWSRFIIARKKGAFDQECDGPNWLTMLERESMLNDLLRILAKHKKFEANYNF